MVDKLDNEINAGLADPKLEARLARKPDTLRGGHRTS